MAHSTGLRTRSSERSRSLFERLRSDDLEETPLTPDPVTARVTSIKSNLVRILNSRRGGSDSSPSYGLSDFNDASMGSSDMLRVIARDIRNVVVTYEPRVSQVIVDFDREFNGGLELFFKVSVQTFIEDKNEQVLIDFVLKEGRNFALR